MHFESLGRYRPAWAMIVLDAPDRFRALDGSLARDQRAELEKAFEEIRAGFFLAEKKIKDQRLISIMKELISMSLEAYVAGDERRGAHAIQECGGFIWSSMRSRLKYVVEAEQRAFGVVELFKNVKVSAYPCEGTAADISARGLALLEHAQSQCKPFLDGGKRFSSIAWEMRADRLIRQTKGASIRKRLAELRAGAATGQIVACVVATFPYGVGPLYFSLEEEKRPRVEIFTTFGSDFDGTLSYQLHEPEIFAALATDA